MTKLRRTDLTRIPPHGRRACVIRAAAGGFVSMSQVVKQVRVLARAVDAADFDPSVDRLKTVAAVRDLRRRGLIARTPWGHRATIDGLNLLRASEANHA